MNQTLNISEYPEQFEIYDDRSKSTDIYVLAESSVWTATNPYKKLYSRWCLPFNCSADARSLEILLCAYHAENKRDRTISCGGYVCAKVPDSVI